MSNFDVTPPGAVNYDLQNPPPSNYFDITTLTTDGLNALIAALYATTVAGVSRVTGTPDDYPNDALYAALLAAGAVFVPTVAGVADLTTADRAAAYWVVWEPGITVNLPASDTSPVIRLAVVDGGGGLATPDFTVSGGGSVNPGLNTLDYDNGGIVLTLFPVPAGFPGGTWAFVGSPQATGTGDVEGPGSATDNHVTFFDGPTGKLIKDSGLALSGTNTGDQAAGTGLTGTSTLSVVYGTSSGTAAQGNDSRLSDSRAPSGAAGGDLSGSYPNPSVAKTYTGPLVFSAYNGTAITSNASATSLLTGASTTGSSTVTASAGQGLRIMGAGQYTNNTGSATTPTLAVKLGSTTILSFTFPSLASSGTARAWVLSVDLFVNASADYRAGGIATLRTGTASDRSGPKTDAIQSGLVLDLVWTNVGGTSNESAALDELTVTKTVATIS